MHHRTPNDWTPDLARMNRELVEHAGQDHEECELVIVGGVAVFRHTCFLRIEATPMEATS